MAELHGLIEALPLVAKPKEVAPIFRTTEGALAQDRSRGRGLPYVKIAGRIRYLRDDVLNYLAENRAEPMHLSSAAPMTSVVEAS